MTGITDPNERYFKNGSWGYYNSKWQPWGLPFAFHDQVLGIAEDLNADDLTNYLQGTAVPSGEIWVITNIMAWNTTNQVSGIVLGVNSGGTTYWLRSSGAKTTRIGLDWQGAVFLKPGDYVIAELRGCTVGDDIHLYYAGYKIEVE